MKKIFTLITMMVLAIAANAQTWVASETAPEAGTTLVDNSDVKMTTVFTTTSNPVAEVDFTDYKLSAYMQVRVDAWPTADVKTGTEKSGSTPVVIEAKKDAKVVVYMRRQSANNTFTAGDGKDVALFDQATAAKVAGELTVISTINDGAYGYCKEVFNVKAGSTYTLCARGTTLQLYAIDVVTEGPAPVEYTVNANVWCRYDDNNYSKEFLGQKVKVAFNYTSEEAGTCDITLPAAVAGPCTMEEQTVTGIAFSIEGSGVALNASEGNFPVIKVKYNGQPVDMTVSFAEGYIFNGELELQVFAHNSELGADVDVTYTGSGIEIPTAVKNAKAANAENKVAKFVKNGKVVIVKDGKAYTVAGAQM